MVPLVHMVPMSVHGSPMVSRVDALGAHGSHGVHGALMWSNHQARSYAPDYTQAHCHVGINLVTRQSTRLVRTIATVGNLHSCVTLILCVLSITMQHHFHLPFIIYI